MTITPTNENLLNALNESVYGHAEAKKTLIMLISRSRMRHYQKYGKLMDTSNLLAPMKTLLIGSSGTGKTHLVESLRKIYPFPLVRLDATNLNPTGASGGTKAEDVPKKIVAAAQYCVDNHPELYPTLDGALDRAIVFVDEIDKLGRKTAYEWNQGTQSAFLTLFDSKTLFNGVSFIFAGAFSELTKPKQKSNKSSGLGFLSKDEQLKSKEVTDQDIIDSGIIPELVGRLTSIVSLDIFTKKEMYDILVNRLLPKKQRDLAAYYIFDTELTDEQLWKIAGDASESEQGVRHMQRSLDKIFLNTEFNAQVDSIILRGM